MSSNTRVGIAMLFKYIVLVYCFVTVRSCSAKVKTGQLEKKDHNPCVLMLATDAILSSKETNIKPCEYNVNNKPKSIETYEYEVGEKLDLSCGLQNLNDGSKEDYSYNIVQKWNGRTLTIPQLNPIFTTNFVYRIYADDIDNGTKVYCTVKKRRDSVNQEYLDYKQSAPITLRMKKDAPGNTTMTEIQFRNNTPLTFHCLDSGHTYPGRIKNGVYHDDIPANDTLTPLDSGIIVFCTITKTKDTTETIIYEREVYNKTKYIHNGTLEVQNGGLVTYEQMGACVGVLFCVMLLAITMFLFYKWRSRAGEFPPNENMDVHANPNHVTYADLELAEPCPGDTVSREESPYAQVTGFLIRKHK